MKLLRDGFTVVELAIIISVIGILAVTTIVGYSGTQQRAEYARAQTDMKHINDAITIFKSQTGVYPVGNDTFQDITNSATPAYSALVDGKYLDTMPTAKTGFAYQYRADVAGVNYKLIRTIDTGTLDSVELTDNNILNTAGTKANNSWGYWSAGGANW